MEENDPIVRRVAAEISRRRFLQGSALVGFSAFLAACGTKGTAPTAPSLAATPTSTAALPSIAST